jgi:hypothetical protein
MNPMDQGMAAGSSVESLVAAQHAQQYENEDSENLVERMWLKAGHDIKTIVPGTLCMK